MPSVVLDMKDNMKKTLRLLCHVTVTILLIASLLSVLGREETAYALCWNPIATAVFAGLALVLVLTEKWFGYFSWILQGVRRWIDSFRRLLEEGKKGVFAVHLISSAVTVLTVLLVGVLILLEYYSHVSVSVAFFATLLAVALQLIDRIVSGRGAEHAKLFLVVAILVGVMMCYTMPPTVYIAWDDETHFGRAANWVFIFKDERSYAEANILVHKGFPGDPFLEDPQGFAQGVLQGSDVPVEYNPSICNPYIALSYSPMMLALAILSLLGADLIKVMILCRLANLLVYALIVYRGIRKLKSGAAIFSAVCLLPCALFLASSHNYDFWLTAWFAYAFSTLIAALQRTDRKLCPSDMWRVLVALFVGCAPKAIYCAILLPLLFIGKDKFENPAHAKKFRIWTIATVGFIAATLIVPGLIVPDLYTDNRGGADVSAAGQISFILSNPFRYAYILLKFLSEYCSLSQMNTYSAFFGYLGNAHVFFGTASAFLLLYCVFTDRRRDDGYERMQVTRWTTLMACFVQIVLIATSLYVGFTPVGLQTINGCQYRYIFPLLIPFCFFLAPKKISCEINPKFQAAFVYGGLALNLMAAFFNVYIGKFII